MHRSKIPNEDTGLKNVFVFLFFFSSGFAALLYQVVWLKYLNLLFGSTIYATAAVLSAFMFGLSFGTWLSSRLSFLFHSPLRSYGLVEIGVGLFATLFPSIYSGSKLPFALIFNAVGPESHLYNGLTFFIAFLVLVIPTSLMGASLPLLSHYLIQERQVSRKSGFLYGINTAGAVVGILSSAFLLIPFLGLHATLYVGVVINLVVGLLCFLGGKDSKSKLLETTQPKEWQDRLLYLYSFSGLLAIGYEVLWTRILVLHLGSSVYAYSIMLAVFLLGVSAGSYLGGRWIERTTTDLNLVFFRIQVLWAFSILLQVVQFAYLSDVLYVLANSFSKLTVTRHFVVLFVGVMQILILPTFLSGALFPLLVAKLHKAGESIRSAVSLSYSYNTIGGIFGSVVAGVLCIPVFGTQKTLVLFAAGNLLLGLISVLRKGTAPRSSSSAAVLVSLFVFVGVALFVQNRFQILESAGIFRMEGKEKLLNLQEDISATISVETRFEWGEAYRSLSVNGINVAGTSRYLVAIQKLQGHIPLMLAGTEKKKSVLHIGFGSGGTAHSVSLYPNTSITVVELSRGVVRNADGFFRSVNHGIVGSGKLKFVYFDGRSFLQNMRQNFDVILSDSIHPRYSGNGSLYTKEYYELVKARLNPGGVHSQWIPLYSLAEKNLKEILRAFQDVFPNTYVWYINSTINPYIVVTGKKDANAIPVSSIQNAWEVPEIRNDLAGAGVTDSYFLLDYFLFGREGLTRYVHDAEPHIDDRMTVEYESSRIMARIGSWLHNFRNIVSFRESIQGYLEQDEQIHRATYDRFFKATSANLRGQIYFLARKPEEASRCFAEAHFKNEADPDPYVPTPKPE